jgi:hypothetical protein
MPSAYICSLQSLNIELIVSVLIMASFYLVAAVAFAILGYILKVRTGKIEAGI